MGIQKNIRTLQSISNQISIMHQHLARINFDMQMPDVSHERVREDVLDLASRTLDMNRQLQSAISEMKVTDTALRQMIQMGGELIDSPAAQEIRERVSRQAIYEKGTLTDSDPRLPDTEPAPGF